MAQKKPARRSTKKSKVSKTSSKPKSKTAASAKKKVAAKGKAKAKASPPKKSATPKIKKKPVAKAKAKTSRATKKSTPTKKVVKKATSSIKKKPIPRRAKASKPRKVVTKVQPKAPSKRTAKPSTSAKPQATKRAVLSARDRYNIGGLLACAIDQAGDPGLRKLRKALKHLVLPLQEQENLVRLTQGFLIPKLFSDEISDEATRKLAVKELVGFAKNEGHYERDWESDLRQFATWLGVPIT